MTQSNRTTKPSAHCSSDASGAAAAHSKVSNPGRAASSDRRSDALSNLERHASADRHPARAVFHSNSDTTSALDTLGAKGAALGRHVFVSNRLNADASNRIRTHEETHVVQSWNRRFLGRATGIGGRGTSLEREAGFASQIGAPMSPKSRTADPNILRLYDQNELFNTSIAPSWAAELT
ncbi:MAG: eCIS core domain-containing protein, partial [Boseongicola sp.]